MGTLEEQKKVLLPFLQRAQEIEKAEPKVAYYCRLFAVDQALQLPNRAPEITGLLGALLAKLEKDKKVVTLEGGQKDALHCENFALKVFERADRVDRAGRAEKGTSITFYAASYFFEILTQFGPLQPDTAAKQRYAAWRAAEISRALREGRAPAPPPAAAEGQGSLTPEDEALLGELGGMGLGTPGSSLSGSLPGGLPGVVPGSGGSDSWGGEAATGPAFFPGAAAAAAAAAAGSGGGGSGEWGAAAADLPPPPPPVAAPQGGGGVDAEAGLPSLPSPPKRRPLESRPSGIPAWTPPPVRRFESFQKVLFKPESAPAAVRGTVAKVEPGPTEEHPHTYFVALPGHIVTCSDPDALAPELVSGDHVQYAAPSGHSMQATIAEVDNHHWPPNYLVRLADGSYVHTTDDRLQLPPAARPSPLDASMDGEPGVAGEAAPGGGAPSAPAYPPPATAGIAATGPQGGWGAAPSALPPPPPAAVHAATVAAVPAVVPAVPGYQPSLRAITEAQKATKSAASALSFEDVATAVRLLHDALALLTTPGPGR